MRRDWHKKEKDGANTAKEPTKEFGGKGGASAIVPLEPITPETLHMDPRHLWTHNYVTEIVFFFFYYLSSLMHQPDAVSFFLKISERQMLELMLVGGD